MRIDINADIGESFGAYTIGDDQQLFPHITSANIACGFHAGDFNVMKATVRQAAERMVAIGAHPGYPDLQGFGRRELAMTPREIYNAVVYQIGALQAFCGIQDVPISHVKPHGALYNTAAIRTDIAEAIAEAVYDTVPEAYLFGLCNSELLLAGEKIGLKTAGEAFADRLYDKDGRLCSRQLPNAVLHSIEEIEQQVMDIVLEGKVTAISGETIKLTADTICFHGDGSDVVRNVKKVCDLLASKNVSVQAVGDKR